MMHSFCLLPYYITDNPMKEKRLGVVGAKISSDSLVTTLLQL
ncbi:hypothetical protein [uncultured Dysgonomonas sp.]|nr:hypothetical protein [uncultured Dysgonomonas sp.]